MSRSLFFTLIASLAACTPGSTGKASDTEPIAVDTDTGTDTDASSDTDTGTGPDLSWAVVDTCASRHTGGFNDWAEAGGRAIMVSGDGDEETSLANDAFDDYSALVGDYFDSFELRAYADLTDDDRTANLFIIGSPDTQPLLAEMDGDLPVRFSDGAFVFGGQLWDSPADGIALDHPSPFAPGSMVLVFAGNSYDGTYNTFSVLTGRKDYVVVSGEGAQAESGDLCTDTTPWSYVSGS